MIIAYESGFCPDLNVAMSSIPVNQFVDLGTNQIGEDIITLNPKFEAKLVSYPQGIRSGAGDANYFELFLDCTFIYKEQIGERI